MKKLTVPIIAFAVSMTFTCPLAFAGGHETAPQTGQMEETGQMHASAAFSDIDLIGKKVMSQDGEELGEIKQVQRDDTGDISYVTMASGGILGMGQKSLAVPLEALSFSEEQTHATLLVDRSKLDNIPRQAEMSNEEFKRQLHSHYGIAPAWEKESPEKMETTE